VDLTASLRQIIAALEAKDVSARELLDAHLERIERLDGPINAVVTLDVTRARESASTIDQQRASGATVGVLAGVPTTIKDAIATEGIRSTGGAVELRDHIPVEDATVVTKLRDEGAVIFGKTNLPRWSADYQSYNELFGTTNNPWDLQRTPGGSSGGAAAAVAMGFSPFEIGTDIGGSIRLPASFCGIYGHKPSFGVVPTHGYLDNPTYHRSVADVNVFGPLARSIDDLELLLGLIAGPNLDDARAWQLHLPAPKAASLGDFRVAAWFDDALGPLDPTLTAIYEELVTSLDDAGARIDTEARPAIDPILAARLGMVLIGSATELSETPEELADRRSAGDLLAHRDWDEMDRQRGLVRGSWAEFFTDVDVLLCPVTCVPPFEHVHATAGSNFSQSSLADHRDRPYLDLLYWNSLIGSSYLPVTTAPVGRTSHGLPVGVQIVAPYLDDRTALAFARCLQEVIGGYEPPPAAC